MSGHIGPLTAGCPVAPRQLEVLQIIERSLARRGFPPSYREIVVDLGLSPHSRQTVHDHLTRLEAKGMLVRHPRVARGLALTDAARTVLAAARAAAAAATMGATTQ